MLLSNMIPSLFILSLILARPPTPPPPQWAMATSFTRFLDHTQRRTTVSKTPLYEWSARRRDLYLKTHNIQNRHPSPLHPVGFEPTTSAGECLQTQTLDRSANVIGNIFTIRYYNDTVSTIYSQIQTTLDFAEFLNERNLVCGSNPQFPSTVPCLQGRLIQLWVMTAILMNNELKILYTILYINNKIINYLFYCSYGTYSGSIIFPKSSSRTRI